MYINIYNIYKFTDRGDRWGGAIRRLTRKCRGRSECHIPDVGSKGQFSLGPGEMFGEILRTV